MGDLPDPETMLALGDPSCELDPENQNSQPPRRTPVQIDYVLYVKNRAYQQPPSSRGRTGAQATKQWTKMVRKPSLGPLEINLQAISWRMFQNKVIIHICGGKEFRAKFLKDANALGEITWHASISGHSKYGVSHLFKVKNTSNFSEFATASAAAPNKRVQFNLTMVDPHEKAKDTAKEAQIDTVLMMKYGPPEKRAVLQREQLCLASNAKADTDPVNPIIAKIRSKCEMRRAGGSEALVFTCPEDPTRTMLLPFKQLWTWARAILNNEPGVDYDHPPTTELFVWRSIQNASGSSKPSGHSGPSSSLNASINGRSPIKRPSEADQYPQKRSASLQSTGSSDFQVVSQAQIGANEIEILSGTPRSLPESPCPSSLMRNVSLATRHQFLAFPSQPAPLGPENPVLESIPMEIFLHEANIPDDDRATRLRLELNGIYKWTYFRSSSELQLIDIGFTPGAARSLCEGVPRLIARYGNISASGPNAHKDDKEDMLDE